MTFICVFGKEKMEVAVKLRDVMQHFFTLFGFSLNSVFYCLNY